MRVLLLLIALIGSPAYGAVPIDSQDSANALHQESVQGSNITKLSYTLTFDQLDPLDVGETISVILFDSNNTQLAGASFTGLTQSVVGCNCFDMEIPPDSLTDVFYTRIEAVSGSMILNGASAVLYGTSSIDSLGDVVAVDSGAGYDWGANPINVWVKVPDSDPVAQITAQLDAAGFDSSKYRPAGAVGGSFYAWVGGAIDQAKGQFWLTWSGSHNNSSLNGIWKFNIDQMDWVIAEMPSDPFDATYPWSQEYWDSYQYREYIPEEDTPFYDILPDSRPTSRHTYNATWFDSTRNTPGNGMYSFWRYDPVTREEIHQQWVNDATDTPMVTGFEVNMIYDEVTDKVIGALPSHGGGSTYRWVTADPVTGRYTGQTNSPLRVSPTCYVKNDRTIHGLGGSSGQLWADYDIDSQTWTSGNQIDMPVHDAITGSMQVCIYIPETGQILRQFTDGDMRGDWYMYDPVTKINTPHTPAGNIPLGLHTGTSAFYYESAKSIVYIEVGGPEKPDDDAIYVMRVGEEEEGTPGNCILDDVGEVYPECRVTYEPPLPPNNGTYTDGSCPDIVVPEFEVTLQDRESIDAAYDRLRDLSGGTGGTLYIPWDVDMIQCDYLYVGDGQPLPDGFKLSGVLGPNGERPRMYCRRDTRDGNIPAGYAGNSNPLRLYNSPGSHVLIENMHIDGYGTGVSNFAEFNLTVRNSYFHHGTSNGIGNSDIDDGVNQGNLQFCGNEVSHYGQGNFVHNFYLHRAVGGGGTEFEGTANWSTITITDSILHSAYDSSVVKSIANQNTLLNNKFYGSLITDPSYSVQESTMLADIIGCGKNVIRGNEFYGTKSRATGNDILIGLRNRKSIRGCDLPIGWSMDGVIPPTEIPGPYHTDEYWTDLNNEVVFGTQITGNTFYTSGEYAEKMYATTFMGTYPNYTEKTGSSITCYLPMPDTWYERAKAIMSGNTYVGIDQDHAYRNFPPEHTTTCTVQPAPGPGPDVSMDVFDIGAGEVFNP